MAAEGHMPPPHLPGWALPNGHIVRSNMEAAICNYLSAALEPHVHGAYEDMSFEVPIGPNRHVLFVPSIMLTHTKKDGRTILIEPIDSIRPGGGMRRLRGFRKRFKDSFYLILITRRVLHHDIPEDAYDFWLALEDFETPLDEFLRAL
jgi:hypothetical protein